MFLGERMKKLLFFLALFALFGLGVNAEIVSTNTEIQKIGSNKYVAVLDTKNKWIQDENSTWQDFNQVVNISARDWKVYIEWRDNWIELNPFIIYNDEKWYLEDIPEEYRSQINWRNVLQRARYEYKWLFKAKKLAQFDWVGFDVNSNVHFQLDHNNFRVNINDELSFFYYDLIASGFELRKQVLPNGLIEFRIGNLGENGSEIVGDPEISLDASWDVEIIKSRRREDFFWVISYACSSLKLTPRRIGRDDLGGGAWDKGRVYHKWDISGIPSNANVLRVDGNFYIDFGFAAGGEQNELRAVAIDPSNLPCGGAQGATLFNLIESSTLYIQSAYWNNDGWWKGFTIGEEDSDIASDIESHLSNGTEWFSIGMKATLESSMDDYLSLSNFLQDGAVLTIEYELPEEEPIFLIDDYDHNAFKKRNLFPWIVFFGLVFAVFFFVVVNE